MSWMSCYQPPDASLWQGRVDSPPRACFFQVIQLIDLQTQQIEFFPEPCFGFIGFCCDEGIRRNGGRLGAVQGPNAIRTVLSKLALHRHCFLIDVGDIHCRNTHLESAQAALGEVVSYLLKHKVTPIVLGGGHELAWGHYQGIEKIYPRETLGIVNFDAHFDMRPLLQNNQGSSGTPFLQIAEAHQQKKRQFHYHCIGIQPASNTKLLFEIAKKYGVKTILADECARGDVQKCKNLIHHVIEQNQILYVSLCLDAFSAAYAPGVSAPQALGLIPSDIIPLLHALSTSGKVVSYDIAELSPKYDIDNRTAKLAAHFIYEIMHYHIPIGISHESNTAT